MKKLIGILLVLLAGMFFIACEDSGVPDAQDAATDKAAEHAGNLYVPGNDIDFNNFSDMLQVADDPSTILWCTFFPPTVGQQPFTVPVVQMLSSSERTAFPTKFVRDPEGNRLEVMEKADPTGMYGLTVSYLYGFDPTRSVFSMFKDLPAFCTTEPRVWQKNETAIVAKPAADLVALTGRAQEALRAGDMEKAKTILESAGQ